jgi:hypothetical protein
VLVDEHREISSLMGIEDAVESLAAHVLPPAG